jgi:hypothetical protein
MKKNPKTDHLVPEVNQHPQAHRPLDAHYNSVVDEPQQVGCD